MNLIEIIAFLVVLFWMIANLSPKFRNSNWKRALPVAALVLILIDYLQLRHRWQIAPAAIFTVGLLMVDLIQAKNKAGVKNKVLRAVLIVLSFLLFGVALVFPLLLPVVNLPAPDGPYAVGTVNFRLTDTSREETFTADPDDLRSLLVTAWYPAQEVDGERPVTYWDNSGITGKEYSLHAGMGAFWYSHLSDVRTNSYSRAPIASEESAYPVIVYSHSFVGLTTENTMLFEELASRGYIVFSIGHSYETIVSVYPNDEVVGEDYDYIASLYDAHSERESELYQAFGAAQNQAEKHSILEQIFTVDEISTHMLRVRTEDVLFVLDELEKLNQDGGMFDSRLDLEHLGVMGWSFGGATAMDACMEDVRLKACVNIDGWPYGEDFNSDLALQQPFMVVNAGTDDEVEQLVGEMVFQRAENDSYRLMIAGAEHTNFWDFPLFFNVYQYIGYWGPIDPLRLKEIEGAYVVGFFDKYLKNEVVGELDTGVSAYPEVKVEVR